MEAFEIDACRFKEDSGNPSKRRIRKSTMKKTHPSDFARTMYGSQTEMNLRLRHVENREWILWAATVVITLLLTAGIVSFLFPLLRAAGNSDSFFNLQTEMIGLLGVVLLFDLYTIYQQLQIHRIRRQLLESQQVFRLISENAADMIAVVDVQGQRVYNSQSYEKILGYSPEDLQKSSSFEQIHPDDRQRVHEASLEARRTGVGKTLEFRMRHKNGSWRALESTASVISSTGGVPDRLVIVSRDITDRKKAIEALRVSEASFRSLVEDAPYGIYQADDEGCFLRVNPALQRMLGYSTSDELLDVNLEKEIFRRLDDFRTMQQTLYSFDEFKDLEIEWRKKDGTPITVRCTGRRVKEENGTSALHEVFAEDVTDKRILEGRLRMAGKMEAIGRLSGGVAHDFNNILGVMIGYSQLLKRKLTSEKELSEYAAEIEKAGQRAASLTRQLLAFSRQQILTPTVLDLNTLIADMEKMLPRLIGEDIAVRIALDKDLGTVKADQGQVEQVIMNLAVNARDAMPAGGTLCMETANKQLDELYCREHPGAKPGRYVMLSVSDSGVGMDKETITHIFEPFFTTKELGKGTGLGLATVYGIVKQSDGYIGVNSSPGEGTSFQIYLPRVDEPVAPTPAVVSLEPHAKGSETILLAEDSEALRKLAKSLLEGHGFHVLTASSGEEALERARQHPAPIDLLLTDVVMPGINGRVLAERLQGTRPTTKILYMSGYTDSFIAGHGVLDQKTNLLYKPFTEEQLIERVRKVLDMVLEEARVGQIRDNQR
jgi:two-component system, cell cycle sensor histidine kinase and response regulator CckA